MQVLNQVITGERAVGAEEGEGGGVKAGSRIGVVPLDRCRFRLNELGGELRRRIGGHYVSSGCFDVAGKFFVNLIRLTDRNFAWRRLLFSKLERCSAASTRSEQSAESLHAHSQASQREYHPSNDRHGKD